MKLITSSGMVSKDNNKYYSKHLFGGAFLIRQKEEVRWLADRIKGITVEIGGDTTGLLKALKGVNATIKTTQSFLRDVNRLLKLDPLNTTLLAQKQRILKESISATKEKLDMVMIGTVLKMAQ